MFNSYKKRVEEIKKGYFYPAISALSGKVLEIGFGNGDSFPYYSNETTIFALEKSPKKVLALKQNLKSDSNKDIMPVYGEAEDLPFENNSFDAVVVSFALCSVVSVEKTIREIYRVLKTGGKFIALEHIRSENEFIGKFQDVIARPWSCIANGCHLNRNPKQLIALGDFKIEQESHFKNSIENYSFILSSK